MAGAATAEQLHLDHADEGLVVWSAWYEDNDGDTPDQADLQALVDWGGFTHTVLADPEHRTDHLFDPDELTRPTWALIAPGGEVVYTGREPAEERVVDALPRATPP